MNQVQTGARPPKKTMKTKTAQEPEVEGLRERVEQVRDLVEHVRETAEVAFQEKPYLLPLTAGAVGFGVGVLVGSRLARFIVYTAVGTVLSDTLGAEMKRMSKDFLSEFGRRLTAGDEEEIDGGDAITAD